MVLQFAIRHSADRALRALRTACVSSFVRLLIGYVTAGTFLPVRGRVALPFVAILMVLQFAIRHSADRALRALRTACVSSFVRLLVGYVTAGTFLPVRGRVALPFVAVVMTARLTVRLTADRALRALRTACVSSFVRLLIGYVTAGTFLPVRGRVALPFATITVRMIQLRDGFELDRITSYTRELSFALMLFRCGNGHNALIPQVRTIVLSAVAVCALTVLPVLRLILGPFVLIQMSQRRAVSKGLRSLLSTYGTAVIVNSGIRTICLGFQTCSAWVLLVEYVGMLYRNYTVDKSKFDLVKIAVKNAARVSKLDVCIALRCVLLDLERKGNQRAVFGVVLRGHAVVPGNVKGMILVIVTEYSLIEQFAVGRRNQFQPGRIVSKTQIHGYDTGIVAHGCSDGHRLPRRSLSRAQGNGGGSDSIRRRNNGAEQHSNN